MSEVIVNRTPETIFQERERQKLEDSNEASQVETAENEGMGSSVAATTTKTIWDTPQGQEAIDKVVEQAAVELGAAKPVTSFRSSVGAKPFIDAARAEAEQSGKDLDAIDAIVEHAEGSITVEKLVEALGLKQPEPGNGPGVVLQIKELRRQTMAAFKELGLDVNKFFGAS